MSELSYTDLRWQHVEGLDIPLVVYADQEWVPLADLAHALDVPTNRLRNAAFSPLNLGRVCVANVLCAKQMRVAIARASLPSLAHRLRPGTNNKLLRLIAAAETIAAGAPLSVFANRILQNRLTLEARDRREREARETRRRRAETMRRLTLAFDAGADIRDLEAQWRAETGLGPATLHQALRGHHLTTIARDAFPTAAHRPAPRKFSRGTGAKRTGKKPLIDAAGIVSLRAEAAGGVATRVLAKKYGLAPATVSAIRCGSHASAAMSEALRIEGAGTVPERVRENGLS